MSNTARPINELDGDDRPINKFLVLLSDVTSNGTGWTARCPSHTDDKPSLSISEGDDRRVLLCCHAGCSYESIVTAMGLSTRDLFGNATNHDLEPAIVSSRAPRSESDLRLFNTPDEAIKSLERKFGPTSSRWKYRNVDGTVVGMVLRWDTPGGKEIRPIALRGDRWVIGAMAEPRPLFNLSGLDENEPTIYVTEGEKAAVALWKIGVAATTSSGGAGAASKTDWGPLAGMNAVVLRDNDLAGQNYASSVAQELLDLPIPAKVKIVELPGLPPKGDAWDWIESNRSESDEDLVATLTALSDAAPLISSVDAQATTNLPASSSVPGPENSTSVPPPPQPFPLDQIPSPFREFILAKSQSIGVDPCQIALPLLTAAGAAIGNTRRLHVQDDWYAPPILWTAVVAESGSGKTPALNVALKFTDDQQSKSSLLHDREMADYRAKLLVYQRSVTSWKNDESSETPPEMPQKPILKMYRVTDCTTEALATDLSENPRGLLMGREELSGWLHGHDRYFRGSADQAAYLEMYGAGSFSVSRKSSGRLHVPRASVSVTGTIQPGILRKLLGAEQRENGLQARFLFAYPERRIRGFYKTSFDPQVTEHVTTVFDRLYQLEFDTVFERQWQFDLDTPGGCPRRPINLELSPRALEEFEANTMRLRKEGFTLPADLNAAYSKLEEIPARLALIIHETRVAADDPALEDKSIVDLASMQAGIELTKWFEYETRRVYAMLGRSPSTPMNEASAEQSQQHLVGWIRTKGSPVTARDVHMTLRSRYPKAEDADRALDALVAAGLGYWEPIEPTRGGGRPTRRFHLNE